MALDAKDVANYAQLARVGIALRHVPRMIQAMGMDGNDVGINPSPLPGITAPSIASPSPCRTRCRSTSRCRTRSERSPSGSG
jgi:hypothetical protein